MSAYISFYMAVDGKVVPLYDFSRNSKMFMVASNYVHYESCVELNNNIIRDMRSDFRRAEDSYNESIKSLKDSIDRVAAFNNSVEEKMDTLNGLEGGIHELEEDIDELNYASGTVEFLYEIMSTCKYTDYSDREYLKTVKIIMGYECSIDSVEKFIKEKTE